MTEDEALSYAIEIIDERHSEWRSYVKQFAYRGEYSYADMKQASTLYKEARERLLSMLGAAKGNTRLGSERSTASDQQISERIGPAPIWPLHV